MYFEVKKLCFIFYYDKSFFDANLYFMTSFKSFLSSLFVFSGNNIIPIFVATILLGVAIYSGQTQTFFFIEEAFKQH
mgnify:CR=1 FL=1